MKINYYDVLGVEKSATEAKIRERFRQLARENHPDRYRGPDKGAAEKKFQTLTEAHNVLTNATRRRQHDTEMQAPTGKAPTDFAQIAKAYMAHGVKAYKEGNFSAARENFDMAVKHNSQDAKGFHYLALASSRIPAFMRQAVQAIETAVQREPMNSTYIKDAGLICRRAGLSAKAERYLEQALKWDPESDEIKHALAELQHGRTDPKDGGGKGLLDSLFKKG